MLFLGVSLYILQWDLYQRKVLPETWEKEGVLNFGLLRKGLPLAAQAGLELTVSLGPQSL